MEHAEGRAAGQTTSDAGMVWFIGAGPGDPELITVKGRRLIEQADLVIYAGSLVPREIVACAKDGARVEDSASMTLEQTHALMRDAAPGGGLVARVHTGDPLLYGAAREQMALLEADGIPCAVVPWISAAFAAAAAAKASITVTDTVQRLAVTRLDRRTPGPPGERGSGEPGHREQSAGYL